MMMVNRFFSMGVLAIFAASVSAQILSEKPEARVEYDPRRDFSQYDTYSWMREQKPLENLAEHVRVVRAIEREMKDLGFELDTVKPDARILFRLHVRDAVGARATQRPSVWDPANRRTDITLQRQREGTFTLEMFDGETNALIWKGEITQELGTPDKAEEQINEIVSRVFEKYPTRNGGS